VRQAASAAQQHGRSVPQPGHRAGREARMAGAHGQLSRAGVHVYLRTDSERRLAGPT